MTLYSRGDWPRPRLRAGTAPRTASAAADPGGGAVSLILEALKKLEREKQSPDRGFLVMAHVPWARRRQGGALAGPGSGGSLLAILAAALAVVFFPRGTCAGAAPPESGPRAPRGDGPGNPLASPGRRSTARPSASELEPRPSAASPISAPRPAGAPSPRGAPQSCRSLGRATPGRGSAFHGGRGNARRPGTAPREGGTRGPRLGLNAISRRDGHPVAILNERLVREGDIFDGILVVRIGEAEVEVEVGGKRRIVRF